MSTIKHIDKLPKAPLQEVIFELLWEIDFDERGFAVDKGFALAQGVFAESIANDFKYRKREIPDNVQLTTYPAIIHQFWKNENEWPVVQLGHGVLVFNEIEQNYTWENYKKCLSNVVVKLIDSYKGKIKFTGANLKYIDAIEVGDSDLLTFINENFNLSIKNNFPGSEDLININFNETFNVESIGLLNVIISSGYSPANKQAVIWQSNVLSGKNTVFDEEKLLNWIDEAHKITSHHFKSIVKEDFYATFVNQK